MINHMPPTKGMEPQRNPLQRIKYPTQTDSQYTQPISTKISHKVRRPLVERKTEVFLSGL